VRVTGALEWGVLAILGMACHHARPAIDLSCDQLQLDSLNPRSTLQLRPGTFIDSVLAARGQGQLVVRIQASADSALPTPDAFVRISGDSALVQSGALHPAGEALVIDTGRIFFQVRCLGCVGAQRATVIAAGRTDTLEVRPPAAHTVCDSPRASEFGEQRRRLPAPAT